MTDRSHRRVTPSQRHLLRVIRSFGPAGATARQIRLRAARTRRALEREAAHMTKAALRARDARRAQDWHTRRGGKSMGATMTATTSPGRLEQRLEALERANEIRRLRAQLKRDLKAGHKAIEEVLSRPPNYLASATILDLLIWTPKRKRTKASRVLQRCQISASRTVGELTERQRQVLLAHLQRQGS